MLSYAKTSGSSDAGLKQRAALYNELAHARWLLLCVKKQDEQAIAEARAEITYLAQDFEDGVLPALTASAFVSAAAAGAFVTAEQADAGASTETAPLSQVELDDKTREIELPDKSDNELF